VQQESDSSRAKDPNLGRHTCSVLACSLASSFWNRSAKFASRNSIGDAIHRTVEARRM